MNHLSLGRLGLCCLLCCGCLSCAILKTSLQPLQSPIIPKLSMFRPPISPLFIQGRVSIPNCLDTNTTYQPASNLIPWDCNCTASIEYWRGRGGAGWLVATLTGQAGIMAVLASSDQQQSPPATLV